MTETIEIIKKKARTFFFLGKKIIKMLEEPPISFGDGHYKVRRLETRRKKETEVVGKKKKGNSSSLQKRLSATVPFLYAYSTPKVYSAKIHLKRNKKNIYSSFSFQRVGRKSVDVQVSSSSTQKKGKV